MCSEESLGQKENSCADRDVRKKEKKGRKGKGVIQFGKARGEEEKRREKQESDEKVSGTIERVDAKKNK